MSDHYSNDYSRELIKKHQELVDVYKEQNRILREIINALEEYLKEIGVENENSSH